jgi:hypothetical protein
MSSLSDFIWLSRKKGGDEDARVFLIGYTGGRKDRDNLVSHFGSRIE